MKKVAVTMSRDMYLLLLNGRKATAEIPGVRACKTHEGVIEYLNSYYGLRGIITEVIVE